MNLKIENEIKKQGVAETLFFLGERLENFGR